MDSRLPEACKMESSERIGESAQSGAAYLRGTPKETIFFITFNRLVNYLTAMLNKNI